MYVKMLQPMKEKDSGQGKIKVWMCSMDLLNFGSWVCQSSCLPYWAVSRCQPKSKPLSETSSKIWMHVRIWPMFTIFSGNAKSQLILPTPWSQYPSILHHNPAVPLQTGIAIPWQKRISLELSHSVPDLIVWEIGTKFSPWSLSPPHMYKSSKRISHRLGGGLNYLFFSPVLPLTKPKFLHLIQYTSFWSSLQSAALIILKFNDRSCDSTVSWSFCVTLLAGLNGAVPKEKPIELLSCRELPEHERHWRTLPQKSGKNVVRPISCRARLGVFG